MPARNKHLTHLWHSCEYKTCLLNHRLVHRITEHLAVCFALFRITPAAIIHRRIATSVMRIAGAVMGTTSAIMRAVTTVIVCAGTAV